MKYLTIFRIALILFTISLQANEVKFALDKGQKAIRTYSGDIDQKSSIHCIFYKDRIVKKYGIKPFFIDKNNEIIELNSFIFESEPTIISYHKGKGNITLITSENIIPRSDPSKKKFSIIDFNILTKESSLHEVPENKTPNVTLRLPNRTIFLNYSMKEKKLRSTIIQNGETILKTSYEINKNDSDNFAKVFSSPPKFINKNEYIESGSIDETKVYYDKNQLLFDHFSKNDQSIVSLTLKLQESTSLRSYTIDALDTEKIKNINSFYHRENLFLFYRTKDKTKYAIIDNEKGEIKTNNSIHQVFSGYFNNEKLKTIEKKLNKSRIYKPTITINESIENQHVLRLSYVDQTTYNYYNDWWFHHWMFQNMMMQQQQQMMQQNMNRTMNNLPRFGPNIESLEVYNLTKTSLSKKNESINIVLDSQFNPIEGGSTETIRKNINKDTYLKPFKERAGTKHFTAAFTNKTMRGVFYQKKIKQFSIKSFDL